MHFFPYPGDPEPMHFFPYPGDPEPMHFFPYFDQPERAIPQIAHSVVVSGDFVSEVAALVGSISTLVHASKSQTRTYYTYSRSGHWHGTVKHTNGITLFRTGKSSSLKNAKQAVQNWKEGVI